MNKPSFKINSSTIGFLAAAVIVGGTGIYTDNSGFTIAGAIFLVVGIIQAINQISNKA
jgi:hypothetical protein